MALRIRDGCPECGSVCCKKNGHIHNGKQNYRCKVCGRSFVAYPENRAISSEKRALIKQLLLERISLRGICRAVGVSLRWLLGFITQVYQEAPDSFSSLLAKRWKCMWLNLKLTNCGVSWATRLERVLN